MIASAPALLAANRALRAALRKLERYASAASRLSEKEITLDVPEIVDARALLAALDKTGE